MLSLNKRFVGVMQDDGRFCVYQGNNPSAHGPLVHCAPSTPLSPPSMYHMQLRLDGNLCFSRGPTPAQTPAGPQAALNAYACLPGRPPVAQSYSLVLTDGGNLELLARRPGAATQPYWAMIGPSMPVPVGGPSSLPPQPPASLDLTLPMPRPGFPRTGPPALTAYVIDANGQRDPRAAAPIVCPGQCKLTAPAGTRVEVASAQPVHAWTGPCAKSNSSPEPARKCIVTLTPGPTVMTAVLQ